MKFLISTIVLLFGIGILNAQDDKSSIFVLKGEYLGQSPPGLDPVVFAPEVISTGLDELNSVFSPDGNEFYFSVRNPNFSTIFVSKKIENHWSIPKPLDFTTKYNDIDVSISPDGMKLFFSSNRKSESNEETKSNFDIWYCYREGKNWGKPSKLGNEINSQSDDFYPIVTRDGTFFFNSQRAGQGTNDIYTSKLKNGEYLPAEKLSDKINTEFREFDAYVDPDQKFIIFASDRPGGFGQSDLYISFRTDNNEWSQSTNMGPKINGIGNEFSPYLSPDGKYLFYTRQTWTPIDDPKEPLNRDYYFKALNNFDNLLGNIWWVDSKIINELIPRK
jgi:Tol biopolymer transport system component